jgi:hypothetical protein
MIRKLLFRILALAFAVAITYAVIIVGANSGRTTGYNSYIASIIYKQKRLEATPSPKIIFIGGSNLVMGLDSPRLEQALGLPVVNMGVNAGFGLRFMLNQVKPNLRQGDVVIIVPEYEQFYGHLNGSTTLIEALTIFPQAVAFLDSPEQYAMIAGEFPVFAQGMLNNLFGNLRPREGFVATRQSFNSHGDIVTHLDAPSIDITNYVLLTDKEQSINPETIRVLNEFDEYAEHVGARVFIVFPPIPEKQARENHAQIDAVYNRLRQQARATILGTPADFVFPANYFFDTVYHLNRQGRDARTQKIIELLKPATR